MPLRRRKPPDTSANRGPSGLTWLQKRGYSDWDVSIPHRRFNLLTSLVLAGAMLVTPHAQDKWDIKTGLAPNASVKYAVTTDVTLQGEEHSATMNYVLSTKAAQDGK